MNQIIHLSTSADTTNYVYTQIYCGGASPVTVTINGTVVNLAPGNPLEILIKTITGAANVYLIGTKRILYPPAIING
jgi:hypothetical protein